MVSITFSLSLVLAVVGVYAGLLPPVQGGGPLADPHGAPPEAGLDLAPQLGDARLAAETAQERGLLPLQQGPALTQYNGWVNGYDMDFGIVLLIVRPIRTLLHSNPWAGCKKLPGAPMSYEKTGRQGRVLCII